MSRTVKFPLEYNGNYDMIHDGTGIYWYVIQAKLADKSKCAVVYREPTPGVVDEVIRYPAIYGVPRFYLRPDGQCIVLGPPHTSPVKELERQGPVPGFVPRI